MVVEVISKVSNRRKKSLTFTFRHHIYIINHNTSAYCVVTLVICGLESPKALSPERVMTNHVSKLWLNKIQNPKLDELPLFVMFTARSSKCLWLYSCDKTPCNQVWLHSAPHNYISTSVLETAEKDSILEIPQRD